MTAIRLIAVLGAVLLTVGELVSLDYYTARLTAEHAGQGVVATYVARR